MKRTWLCVLMVAWATTAAMCQEAATAQPKEQQKSEKDVSPLGKNVRLDFKLVPDTNRGLSVVTALPYFETNAHFKKQDGEVNVQVSGNVSLSDNGIFVAYKVHIASTGEAGEMAYNVVASALLQSGQVLDVGNVGDKTFILRASFVEGKLPADAKKQPTE